MVGKRKYRNGRVVWYYAFDLEGSTRGSRRRVQESGFATRKQATEAEAQRRTDESAAAAAPSEAPPPPKTLKDLLSEFLADAKGRLAPKTLERYQEQSLYLSAALTALPIRDVGPQILAGEWARLKASGGRGKRQGKPLSPKTVRNIASVVSAAFARAHRWGLVNANPVGDSDVPTSQRKQGIALSPQQQALLLEAAEGHYGLRAFLELAAATGARRGELLALTWRDVVGDDQLIIAKSLSQTRESLLVKGPKHGPGRVLTLPTSAVSALQRHRRAQETFRLQFGNDYQGDLIFCAFDGSPLKPDSMSALVSNLFRRLKLPKGASLHSLRHTHGSHLLAAGMELPAVAARLGHSSTHVTAQVYSHALQGRDREAAKKWEEFQQVQPPAPKDFRQ